MRNVTLPGGVLGLDLMMRMLQQILPARSKQQTALGESGAEVPRGSFGVGPWNSKCRLEMVLACGFMRMSSSLSTASRNRISAKSLQRTRLGR